ncbi:MAG: sodium:solute symporter family transporter [Candidatus Hydrogenedentota bacterium]
MDDIAIGLDGIDIAIIIIYMVGVFVLGTFFGKYVKNAGDFFIAGKALPFWAIGMSIVVSDIGAMDFVGVAGSAYTHGISVANFDWMGSMPAMVFAAFIFVPYFWRSGVFTIPEFLGRRYNTAVQMIHGTIWAVFLFTMLSLMLWVTGDNLMNTVLGWNPYFVVWLMVLITGVYTFSGGLSAVVMVDVVQLIIMFVGGLSLLFLSMWELGGFAEVQEQVTALEPKMVVLVDQEETVPDDTIHAAFEDAGYTISDFELHENVRRETGQRFVVRFEGLETRGLEGPALVKAMNGIRENAHAKINAALANRIGDPAKVQITKFVTYESHFDILLPHNTYKPYPWTGIVFGLGLVLAIAYMSGNQAVVQRTLGARSEWDAKGGMLFGGFLKAFIPLMVAVPGLAALLVAPNLTDGDDAVPTMIREILPPGLKGLMFVALFAALMSSVDSTLNSATTIWTTDLLGRVKRMISGTPLNEKQGLVIGRIFTVAFIILAGLLAPVIGRTESIYVFIQTALSLFQGPTLAILLLGIMWRRTTQWGGLAGLLLGVVFCFVLNYTEGLFPSDDPFLFVAWWSFVFSMIVTVVVSLLTPADPEAKIRGLVWGSVFHDEDAQSALNERVSE